MTHTFTCYLIGSESLLIRCAQILQQQNHRILGIISDTPAIAAWAKSNNLPLLSPHQNLADALRAEPFDYLFSITNLAVLPPELLDLPRRGAINFHDGPLPRYAGLHATSWAILNREPEHGITWHTITAQVDQGQILSQRLFPLDPAETAFSLNTKCYQAALDTFGPLARALAADQIAPSPQDLSRRTYFGRFHRPPAAAVLNWTRPAAQLSALARALDFGPYANPLGLPKLWANTELLLASGLTALDEPASAPPGTILALEPDRLLVAAADFAVALTGLHTPAGEPLSPAQAAARLGWQVGDRLPLLSDDLTARLTAAGQQAAHQEPFWHSSLANLRPLSLPYIEPDSTRAAAVGVQPLPLPPNAAARPPADLIAAFGLFLARLTQTYEFDLAVSRPNLAQLAPFFAAAVPLRVAVNPAAPLSAAMQTAAADAAQLEARFTYPADIFLRHPDLKAAAPASALPVAVVQSAAGQTPTLPPGAALALHLDDAGAARWLYRVDMLSPAALADLSRRFLLFLHAVLSGSQEAISAIPLLLPQEHQQVLVDWNDTAAGYPGNLCLHQLIEAQAARTPQAVAVVFAGEQLTYDALNRRANQLAHHLQNLGVGPDTPVGIFMDRSLDLPVALLGVLKAGGAYLPLDPAYPAGRLAFMVADAQTPVLLTHSHLRPHLPPHHAQVVCLDTDGPAMAAHPETAPQTGVSPQNLCYVIYTSGSTGQPKGVMVQHGNVINFFTGMDAVVPHNPPGVWLAVTSLSFDISVLELFYTLARGFKVIIHNDSHRAEAALPETVSSANPIDFSLFYFASDESEDGVADKYRLLLEGAKFADTHGFAAVWTPERHFHAFGGLYPNPAVAGAAIAAITQNVAIRAGSCVLPLHHPIRVAEEWALVDNLSRGRVGISFAAGWQPNDFVLRPENFADRKDIMFRDIDTVRRLWRGETLSLPGPTGQAVQVRTLPRPVQPNLPVWITAAGNPETFEMAGVGGYHLLTHLLGQSVDELAQKIAVYRQAWAGAGHPGQGQVTLMLHTLVGPDTAQIKELVRGPMTDYLRSAVGLIKQAAWQFPTFKQRAAATGQTPLDIFESQDLPPEDMEALLAFAFERYFETSGLFGTPEHCLPLVNRLKAVGVNEIACLIDYGVPSAVVMAHLPHLHRLKQLADAPPAADYSLAAQTERHGVTHLQCTPSMAAMLLLNPANRAALGRLQTLLVGGEALPPALAQKLAGLGIDRILNMYGPTETTIWSTTAPVNGALGPVSIGRPIANTQIYLLDSHLQPVPPGLPGELVIGGDGVVRGYLNRPQLTAERFVPNPFSADPAARLYRTGDLARYRPNGDLEFLGRLDHQVKIRGHRIELGEIEAALARHPAVRQAVVVARADTPGDTRLAAYIIPTAAPLDIPALRAHLRAALPEIMIPAAFVTLEAFPLTPNKKIDRKALPAPTASPAGANGAGFAAPTTPVEAELAAIWAAALAVDRVGRHDNFFELGGHSLSAAQVAFKVRQAFGVDFPLQTLFAAPTVAGLADKLAQTLLAQADESELARLLAELDELPEAELQEAAQ